MKTEPESRQEEAKEEKFQWWYEKEIQQLKEQVTHWKGGYNAANETINELKEQLQHEKELSKSFNSAWLKVSEQLQAKEKVNLRWREIAETKDKYLAEQEEKIEQQAQRIKELEESLSELKDPVEFAIVNSICYESYQSLWDKARKLLPLKNV